jgi:Big-like domain-containing protein
MTSSATSSLSLAPTTTETALVAERTAGTRSVVLTADVSAPGGRAGSVTFRDGTTVVGTAPVAAGEATTTLTSVSTGDHVYEATFVPASATTYAGSTSPQQSLTIAASATTTDVTVTSSASTVTFVATVTSPDGVPTGAVELREGGALVTTGVLSGGSATVALPGVAKGAHTYVATYVPADDSFVGSASAATTVNVTGPAPGAATTTGLTVGVVRRTVSLKATVAASTGTPVGSVQFKDGTTVVGSATLVAGSASLTLPGVAAGTHSYTAQFVPASAAAFATSVSAARQVTAAVTATTTKLTGKVSGTTATLRMTIAGTDGLVPVGTVRVFDGSTRVGTVQVDKGRATLVVSKAAVGKHSYRATFVPSTGDFAGSTSARVVLTVRPLASRTRLTVPTKAKAGSRPTIKVKVLRGSAPAAGKVRLTYGGTTVTLTLKRGQASFKLPQVKKGSLKVTATYLGNATTARSTATRSIKVG